MSKLTVSTSPHIRSNVTTQSIMLDVIIALLPALVASVIVFGFRSLLVVSVCVIICVLAELVYEKAMKLPVTIGDLSAVVTGLLLAYNLPVGIPLWQAAFGCIVAIIVVKQLFGGIGQNFVNPAITARVVLLLAFAGSTTTWVFPDGVSTATPLALIENGRVDELPAYWQMLVGYRGGSLGETCAVALVLGGIYLLIRGVISWHTPVAFIATVFVFTLLAGQQPLYQIVSGGLLLGSIFMATDYVTTPPTPMGKIVFGIGAGLITSLIRVFGNYPEGVSFAILLMNILTPYICKFTRSKPMGGIKA